jgi:hypothetical protein
MKIPIAAIYCLLIKDNNNIPINFNTPFSWEVEEFIMECEFKMDSSFKHNRNIRLAEYIINYEIL